MVGSYETAGGGIVKVSRQDLAEDENDSPSPGGIILTLLGTRDENGSKKLMPEARGIYRGGDFMFGAACSGRSENHQSTGCFDGPRMVGSSA